jgi:acyl-CoA thioester hydrolase
MSRGRSAPFFVDKERIMEIRVYYEDTDAGGVVYHAHYLNYFERGRTEYLRENGVSVGELHRAGFIFPVIRVEVEFRSPAVHDDLLLVTTAIGEVGKTTFTLLQTVARKCDGRILVEGRVTLACIGPNLRPKRLPEQLLAVLHGDSDR